MCLHTSTDYAVGAGRTTHHGIKVLKVLHVISISVEKMTATRMELLEDWISRHWHIPTILVALAYIHTGTSLISTGGA